MLMVSRANGCNYLGVYYFRVFSIESLLVMYYNSIYRYLLLDNNRNKELPLLVGRVRLYIHLGLLFYLPNNHLKMERFPVIIKIFGFGISTFGVPGDSVLITDR